METLNAALDLAAKIPDSFAFVGFALAIVFGSVAYGRHAAAADAEAALADIDASHWGENEDPFAAEAFYREAA